MERGVEEPFLECTKFQKIYEYKDYEGALSLKMIEVWNVVGGR